MIKIFKGMTPEQNEYLRFRYLVAACISFRFILGAIMIFLGRDFLSDGKFYTDSSILYGFYANLSSPGRLFQLAPADSFSNTAKIYRLIFLNQDITFTLFLVLSSLLYCVLFIYIINSIEIKNHRKAFIVFLIFFVFDMIFLFQPSKDFLSLLVNVIIFKLILSDLKSKDVYIAILTGLFAFFFREYYFIILFLFFFLRAAYNAVLRVRLALFLILAAGFFVVFYYTDYFDEVMILRYVSGGFLGGYTKTLINDVLPILPGDKNIFVYILNYILIGLRLLFPVEVLWRSPSRGIFFVPLQLLTDYIVFKYLFVLKLKKENIPGDLMKKVTIVKQIVIYILSFFLVSILFEPDFGSVFRHSINLIPFLLYLSFSTSCHEFKGKNNLIIRRIAG